MKKSIIYLVVALTLLSLSLTLVPNVLAQQENIKVLNYSYQIDYSHNILIVYGEVQNVGSSTLMDVVLGGSVYSAGGTDQADSTGQPYAIYIVPQQKVPFEIDFNAPNSSPDGNWGSVSISKIEFTTTQATVTSSYPYPDVKITSQSSSIDTTSAAKGTYWISGNIQNTGSQAAQNIYVVATFYNSSGDTVSAGWSSMIDTLNPKATTSFEVGAFDINMSEITPQQKISSYSLIVRPGDPTLTGNAPDPSAYGIIADSSSSQSSSSSSPTPTGSSTGNNTAGSSNEWLIYAAIIIIIIAVAVVITIKTFPKRKSAESTKTKNSPKVPSKKPQGKVQFSSVSLFKYFLRNWVCL
jgi:hypothetical protein